MNKLRADITVIELVSHLQAHPAGDLPSIDQMAAVIAGEREAKGDEHFPLSFYVQTPLECFGEFSHPATGNRNAVIYGYRVAMHGPRHVCGWDDRRWATFVPGIPTNVDRYGWPE